MGKKSKQIGMENKKQIALSQEKQNQIKEKILELTDEQIDKLFEKGKITQSEYEAILNYRKSKKKKTEKEKFEERVRCNNGIIQRIIALGKKFKKQEKRREERLNQEMVLEREERIRTKSKEKTRER